MAVRCIFLLLCFNFCFSNWVLLPLISKQDEVKKQQNVRQQNFCQVELKNVTDLNFCPDLHNLTSASYFKRKKQDNRSPNGWEISVKDVEDLMKESQQLPKTRNGKSEFVKQISNNLEIEVEKRLETLFLSREARSSHIPFPSMESSLLTISMLLFGVYLTKVILKLLQSHYNRYNTNLGGFMMSGIRAPIIIKTRKERSITSDLEKIYFMNLIDKYNAQYN